MKIFSYYLKVEQNKELTLHLIDKLKCKLTYKRKIKKLSKIEGKNRRVIVLANRYITEKEAETRRKKYKLNKRKKALQKIQQRHAETKVLRKKTFRKTLPQPQGQSKPKKHKNYRAFINYIAQHKLFYKSLKKLNVQTPWVKSLTKKTFLKKLQKLFFVEIKKIPRLLFKNKPYVYKEKRRHKKRILWRTALTINLQRRRKLAFKRRRLNTKRNKFDLLKEQQKYRQKTLRKLNVLRKIQNQTKFKLYKKLFLLYVLRKNKIHFIPPQKAWLKRISNKKRFFFRLKKKKTKSRKTPKKKLSYWKEKQKQFAREKLKRLTRKRFYHFFSKIKSL